MEGVHRWTVCKKHITDCKVVAGDRQYRVSLQDDLVVKRKIVRGNRDEMVEVEVVEGRLWGQNKERVRQTLNSGEEVLKN